jgi:hypothetical protein
LPRERLAETDTGFKGIAYFFNYREPVNLWNIYRNEVNNLDTVTNIISEELKKVTKIRPICPDCGSRKVIPLAIGYPTPETQRQAELGRVVLGGCLGDPENPGWHCKDCEREWK